MLKNIMKLPFGQIEVATRTRGGEGVKTALSSCLGNKQQFVAEEADCE